MGIGSNTDSFGSIDKKWISSYSLCL